VMAKKITKLIEAYEALTGAAIAKATGGKA
jgi:hypothetical protein